MKTQIFKLVFMGFLLTSNICYSQTNSWQCGVQEPPGSSSDIPYIGAQDVNLVVVYLDFPDGRIGGTIVPTTEQELNQVANLDAVLNMGYLSENGIDFTKKARKYTYADCWNRYFSRDIYNGDAHPDWLSHGRWGQPYESAGDPENPKGDTARAYGSLADFYLETSYSNLNIVPYQTHTNDLGEIYRKGIVNNFILGNDGKYHVVPIMMSLTKANYFAVGEEQAILNMLGEAPGRLSYYHSLPPEHPDRIEFDVSSYSGKIIFVFAGGTNAFGGYAGEMVCIVREKLTKNYPENSKRCVINGILLSCHEFGHTLGFGHSTVGNYCVMTTGTDNQNCPSHFNIIYKLKAGWINRENIHFIHDISQISNLTPSEYSGNCAILTIYGRAGYTEHPEYEPPNYSHSEFYVIENRRMLRNDPDIKFDKKFVWKRDRMPNPQQQGFNGGCMIMHYSNYGSFSNGLSYRIIEADQEQLLLWDDEGHSNHFFGVPVIGGLFLNLFDSRTKSSFDLTTGINITNISQDANYSIINFSNNYSLGAPPNYTKVLYGQTLPNPFIMNGTYFLHSTSNLAYTILDGNVEIQPGTILEAVNGGLWYSSSNGNLEANGTIGSPITFQGAGYQSYRLNYKNLKVLNSNNSNNGSIQIKNCSFLSPVPNFELSIQNIISNKDIYLENININGNCNTGIIVDNSVSSVNINSLNFSSSPNKLALSSTTNNQNHAKLNNLTNADFDEYKLEGTWRFDLQNDFTVPSSKKLSIGNAVGFNSEIVYTNPFNTIVDGEIKIFGSFYTNRDIIINSAGICNINAWDKPNSPSFNNFIKFDNGRGLYCNGILNVNAIKDSLYLTVNGSGQWKGITCSNPGNVTLENVKVRNAETGIDITMPGSNVNISNSHFSNNLNYDVSINNIYDNGSNFPYLYNNVFTGNSTKIASVLVNNGVKLRIEGNQFDEDYSIGCSLLWISEPLLISNIFKATTNGGYTPYGIYSYTSGGFLSCNSITNYSDGILLSNSSPFIYKNDIYNNSIGIYLVNSSSPILTPAYSPGGTLYTGGYNRIFENLQEEIYCLNDFFNPTSLPVLNNGMNSIYDNVHQDCLIEAGYSMTPMDYYVKNNYWGGGSPYGRLCSSTFNFIYDPYLTEIPTPPAECDPTFLSANNSSMSESTLLFGSASIDAYNKNYSASISKFQQLISSVNNPNLLYAPVSRMFYAAALDSNANFSFLENYYYNLANQYSSDSIFNWKSNSYSTSSDIEQTEYQEAIDEYQNVINTNQNYYIRHYSYIDQMRTIRLMLDSLLNGNGGLNRFNNENLNKFIGDLMSFATPKIQADSKKIKKEENNKQLKMETNVTTMGQNDINKLISNSKNTLGLENISINSLSKEQKTNIMDKVIQFKLWENAVNNYTPTQRPINRMNIQKELSKGVNNIIPKVFKLYQNYPNPFNPVSTIKYDIPKESMVTIKVYDLIGREVITLVNENKQPGYYENTFNGTNLSSGVYFYRIEAGTFVDIKKMVLIK